MLTGGALLGRTLLGESFRSGALALLLAPPPLLLRPLPLPLPLPLPPLLLLLLLGAAATSLASEGAGASAAAGAPGKADVDLSAERFGASPVAASEEEVDEIELIDEAFGTFSNGVRANRTVVCDDAGDGGALALPLFLAGDGVVEAFLDVTERAGDDARAGDAGRMGGIKF